MSWEEMRTTSIPCPCEKGRITRTDYMDDWNREESRYCIDCIECREKYQVVFRSYYKHPGDSGETYYLLEKNYPEYGGMKLSDVFPVPVDIQKMPFDEFLIRKYTYDDLKTALDELKTVTAVSRLTGCAAGIAKEHKQSFHSAKISVLRSYVASACEKYNEIGDNKDSRLPVEQKEREERSAYDKEMRKHMIRILL